jgi:putative DNA primase/helicase
MGAKNSPYVRAVCRKFQIGLVRRVRDPGCKLDSMLILEGEQGVGKSLQLRDYAGATDLFTDQDILTLDGKGQQELLQGKLICEIAELSGLRRTEVEKVKAFVTRTHDRGRSTTQRP